MPTLSEYTNVFPTALRLLKNKGYQLWFDPATNMFFAERDGWDFASESPCGLLGLVAIYEARAPDEFQDYWWRTEGIDTNELPRAPRPYQSVLLHRQKPR